MNKTNRTQIITSDVTQAKKYNARASSKLYGKFVHMSITQTIDKVLIGALIRGSQQGDRQG